MTGRNAVLVSTRVHKFTHVFCKKSLCPAPPWRRAHKFGRCEDRRSVATPRSRAGSPRSRLSSGPGTRHARLARDFPHFRAIACPASSSGTKYVAIVTPMGTKLSNYDLTPRTALLRVKARGSIEFDGAGLRSIYRGRARFSTPIPGGNGGPRGKPAEERF